MQQQSSGQLTMQHRGADNVIRDVPVTPEFVPMQYRLATDNKGHSWTTHESGKPIAERCRVPSCTVCAEYAVN